MPNPKPNTVTPHHDRGAGCPQDRGEPETQAVIRVHQQLQAILESRRDAPGLARRQGKGKVADGSE